MEISPAPADMYVWVVEEEWATFNGTKLFVWERDLDVRKVAALVVKEGVVHPVTYNLGVVEHERHAPASKDGWDFGGGFRHYVTIQADSMADAWKAFGEKAVGPFSMTDTEIVAKACMTMPKAIADVGGQVAAVRAVLEIRTDADLEAVSELLDGEGLALWQRV